MALHMIEMAARLKLTGSLAACLSVFLASCASSPAPVVIDETSATVAQSDAKPKLQPRLLSRTESPAPVAYIDPGVVIPDAPTDYTVVRGDTLWDISGRFLTEPWRWPEIWNVNPQIADPNLIYPGDALALRYVNGQPTLTLTRTDGSMIRTSGGNSGSGSSGSGNGASGSGSANANGNDNFAGTNAGTGERVKLSPRIRTASIESAIPFIKSEAIAAFLAHPRVIDNDTLEDAAYTIADSGGRLMSSLGSKIFVRGPMNRNQTNYSIYRKNEPLQDPVTGENLGYELTHVSNAQLLNVGEVSTLGLTTNIMETKTGDILLPTTTENYVPDLKPRMPALEGEGRVVNLVGAISQTGRSQIIVLNVGIRNDIAAGDVLAIESQGDTIVDNVRGKNEKVKLPDQRTGVVLVFEAFDKVSYGLIMESTRPIKVNDVVTGI